MAKIILLSFIIIAPLLLCQGVISSDIGFLLPQTNQTTNQKKTWCVAKPDASEVRLNNWIQYCCTEPLHCCTLVAVNNPCYLPNNVVDHASVCLNEFYKAHGGTVDRCPSFIGQITQTDPSHGTCIFP